MNRMDKWLSQNKNFMALVTSILLIISVISVVIICANITRNRSQLIEETEPTEHVAAVVNIVEEPTTVKEDIPETTAETKPEPETEPETEPPKSAEELAWEVINGGYNGPERERYLGERYQEVQNWIDANYIPPTPAYVEPVYENNASYDAGYSYPSGGGVLSPSAGVNYYNGIMETYYNLPMGGVLDIMYTLGYSGDYWVRSDGVKMFGNYIMVAADFGWLPRGSVVECSLGTAMVCDTGSGGYGWLDIAVTW